MTKLPTLVEVSVPATVNFKEEVEVFEMVCVLEMGIMTSMIKKMIERTVSCVVREYCHRVACGRAARQTLLIMMKMKMTMVLMLVVVAVRLMMVLVLGQVCICAFGDRSHPRNLD